MIKTDMKGKIALVTGAASGLARATAEVLASPVCDLVSLAPTG